MGHKLGIIYLGIKFYLYKKLFFGSSSQKKIYKNILNIPKI